MTVVGAVLFLLPLSQVLAQPAYELLQRDVEGITDPQQSEDRDRAARLHHLPVPDAEAVRDHVLLA